MDFGQAIRTLRKEHDMTQVQLAERCSVSRNAVSAWETGIGYPPKAAVERICRAFDIPVAYFILESIEEGDIPERNREVFLTLLSPLRNLLLDKEP